MSLRSRWKSWKHIPAEMRWMLVEAAVTLAATRLVVGCSLQWCAPWMLKEPPGEQLLNGSPPLLLERQIRCAIRMASRAVPWKSVCLPNAMAGKLMLHRRGWPSTIHLGVSQHATGSLHAHAWLEAGGIVIAGEEGMHRVVPFPAARSAQ